MARCSPYTVIRWKPQVVAVLTLMSVAACIQGCGPVTVTSAPTVAATSTPSMTPSAVPASWNLVLNDPLQTNPAQNWDTGPDPAVPGTNRQFNDGGYHFTALANGYIEGLDNRPADIFTDFYYQATMVITAGTTDAGGGAGLVFRSDSTGSDYFFTFDAAGNWSLELYQAQKQKLSMLRNGASTSFLTGFGKVNVLGVKAVGSTITLYVNGYNLMPVPKSDTTIGAGVIGFTLNAGAQLRADAVFRDARVWVPLHM